MSLEELKMSKENSGYINETIKLVVGVATVFAAFYGVGNIINRIDEMKIRQVTLEVKLEIITIQLQEVRAAQKQYWDELKSQGIIKK